MRISKKYRPVLFFVPFILIVDQITKEWVLRSFHLHETREVLKNFFNLTYVRNNGAAFGLLAESHPDFRVPFFFVIPALALGVIIYFYKKLPEDKQGVAAALALVIGGAVGNLLDRVRFGYVIDFLDFHLNYNYHFPAFNVADVAICIGVGVVILDLFINPDPLLERSPEKIERATAEK